MPAQDVIHRLDSLDAGGTGTTLFGLDAASFCKLAALKHNVRNNTTPNVIFDHPLVRPTGPGVIFTTYFNSRVDPLRCWKHKAGRLAPDMFEYIQDWYASVHRLGLPAIVFHEGLSDAFVAKVSTENIQFQRIQLANYEWSLCDERWAVFHDWLLSPAAAGVEWVLSVDVSDTVVSRDPFELFRSQADEHDLWINVQKHSRWVDKNYAQCYENRAAELGPLPAGNVYNAGVVGGSKTAFLDLAAEILKEFRDILGHNEERQVWNCDMSSLQWVATRPEFLARQRVFNSGHPFCAGTIKCWKHGVCDYHVYHK
jgi:hypothetical protein